MEGAGASADEDALRAYLEEHPMPRFHVRVRLWLP